MYWFAKAFIITLFISLFLFSNGYSQNSRVMALIDKLNDNDIDVRLAALKELGEFKDMRAIESLIVALKDSDEQIRTCAAESLGRIKDPRAVEPLIKSFKDYDSFVSRVVKSNTLFDNILITKLKNINSSIVNSLVEIGSSSVEPLIAALHHDKVFVRFCAVYTLGKIKDTLAIEPLISMLNDRHNIIQFCAAESLSKIKNLRSTSALIASFKNKNMYAVAGAYPFFISQGRSGTEQFLIESLNKYGDKHMAEDFLNSKNSKLEHAARLWANLHGYRIDSYPVSSGNPIWSKKGN
jgi:bilin biosynthesis protein